MLKLQRHFLMLLSTLAMDSGDTDSDSIGSESSGSGSSDESSGSGDESSSVVSVYSSSESSSGRPPERRRGRRAYRQGYDAALRDQDYRQIPPRRRRF